MWGLIMTARNELLLDYWSILAKVLVLKWFIKFTTQFGFWIT